MHLTIFCENQQRFLLHIVEIIYLKAHLTQPKESLGVFFAVAIWCTGSCSLVITPL